MVAHGEIWWLETPDEKRRPVLVVSRDEAIPVLRNVVVAPVTSTLRRIPTCLPVGPSTASTTRARRRSTTSPRCRRCSSPAGSECSVRRTGRRSAAPLRSSRRLLTSAARELEDAGMALGGEGGAVLGEDPAVALVVVVALALVGGVQAGGDDEPLAGPGRRRGAGSGCGRGSPGRSGSCGGRAASSARPGTTGAAAGGRPRTSARRGPRGGSTPTRWRRNGWRPPPSGRKSRCSGARRQLHPHQLGLRHRRLRVTPLGHLQLVEPGRPPDAGRAVEHQALTGGHRAQRHHGVAADAGTAGRRREGRGRDQLVAVVDRAAVGDVGPAVVQPAVAERVEHGGRWPSRRCARPPPGRRRSRPRPRRPRRGWDWPRSSRAGRARRP